VSSCAVRALEERARVCVSSVSPEHCGAGGGDNGAAESAGVQQLVMYMPADRVEA